MSEGRPRQTRADGPHELLPWYVNGTLEAEEAAAFRRHLDGVDDASRPLGVALHGALYPARLELPERLAPYVGLDDVVGNERPLLAAGGDRRQKQDREADRRTGEREILEMHRGVPLGLVTNVGELAMSGAG